MKTDPRRRWIEWGKNLLILLLSLSALALAYQSPLVQGSGLQELFRAPLADSASPLTVPSVLSVSSSPVQMAVGVGDSMELYGVQYNQETVDALFNTAGPLLGDALSEAGEPRSITERQWQALLSGQCIYFDFASPVPLTVLCAWLSGDGGSDVLADSARRIILAPGQDGAILLCYREDEDGGFFQCATTLNAELLLSPITESVTPNGAFFAFEDSSLPDVVDPYTLFADEGARAWIYTSATPLILSDSAQTARLMSALSFSDQNQAAASEGMLYVDGDDTLRLSGSGRVSYSASSPGKYPAGEGLNGAIKAAWALAEAALGAVDGDARLYLISAQSSGESGDAYTITFGYTLNGSLVYLYDQGWAAQFQVQGGCIHRFTLYLRTYSSTGQQALLLPADKACAALTVLSDQPLELAVLYQDNGGSQILPSWVGR